MSQEAINNAEDTRPTVKELAPADKFFRNFQEEVTNIQSLISGLSSTSTTGGERGDAIDHCLASIARLSQEVKDASSYLPAYDQRTYSEAIKALGTKLQGTRASLEPKKKFSFKSRGGGQGTNNAGKGSMFTAKKNESALSLEDAAESAAQRRREGGEYLHGYREEGGGSSHTNTPAQPPSPPPEPPETDEANGKANIGAADLANIPKPSVTNMTLADENNMHILLSPTASTSSGTLAMLTRCIVDMSNTWKSDSKPHALQTLTIKDVKDSLLICPRVHGAAHLTDITNSTIVLTSHQFRMHNSRNCDVYLVCTSRPIIEDCSGIRVAPLPSRYITAEDAGVSNQWQNVDDFNWLRAEPSPNWSLLPEAERVSERVWREVVPGSPKYGLEEILREVGIAR